MKENQNGVVVVNPPGSLSLYCQTVIAPLLHQYRYAVLLLLLFCCTAIARLSHHYCSAVATLLSIRCRATVTPLLHRYCFTVAPLLSLLLSIRSHTAIAPVSLHCCSAAVAPAVAMQSTGIQTLSRRCRTAIAPTQRGYK